MEIKKEDLVIKQEDLSKATIEEAQEQMKADVITFAEEIQTWDDPEKLKSLEADLMGIFKTNDEYLQGVEYELAPEATYDDQTIKRSDIINRIIRFINKMEVEFRATLGIYQAIRYWKTKGANNVPYAVFDSTIRMLGTLKFKGEEECFDILVINNWFAGAHEKYIRDNAYTNYLAAKHQIILKRLGELESPEAPESVGE